jgi:hypothetical protein
LAGEEEELKAIGICKRLSSDKSRKAGGAELSRPTDLISQQSNYSRFKFPRIKLIIAVVASLEVKIMAMPATLQDGIFSLGIKSHLITGISVPLFPCSRTNNRGNTG